MPDYFGEVTSTRAAVVLPFVCSWTLTLLMLLLCCPEGFPAITPDGRNMRNKTQLILQSCRFFDSWETFTFISNIGEPAWVLFGDHLPKWLTFWCFLLLIPPQLDFDKPVLLGGGLLHKATCEHCSKITHAGSVVFHQ